MIHGIKETRHNNIPEKPNRQLLEKDQPRLIFQDIIVNENGRQKRNDDYVSIDQNWPEPNQRFIGYGIVVVTSLLWLRWLVRLMKTAKEAPIVAIPKIGRKTNVDLK